MMKKDKQPLKPKLRFPEFREAPGWKERTLSEVLSEHGEKSTGAEQVFSVSVHKGIINQIEHLGRSFSAASTDHYNRVLPGDIVYTKSPTGDFPLGIIKQSKLDVSVIVSPLYGVFSPETIAMGTILDAYFESPANTKFYLESLVQKGAKNTINIKNCRFLSGVLVLPLGKDEQQKIADCLTSVDNLIAAHEQKLAALRNHKKGLMQQLFPREGESIPRLRFPEFQGAGEWDAAELEEMTKFITERIPLEQIELMNYISTENILSDCGGITRASKLPSTGSVTKFRLNDTLVSNIRPYLKKVWFSTKNGGASNDVIVIRAKHKLLAQYLSFLLKNDSFIDYVMKGAKGVKMPRGDVSLIKKYPVFYPSKLEQQRIANCLSTLDDQITAQTQKIAALQQHKQGLMQQLFPSPRGD